MAVFIFLLALWLLFNGKITLDVVCVGAVVSGLVTWFAISVCGWTKSNRKTVLKVSGLLIEYAFVLLYEIIKANIDVMKVILLSRKNELKPQLITYNSLLQNEAIQTIMGNSITITPGTYTVGIYDSHIFVHALNSDFAKQEPDSNLNRRLIAIENAMLRSAQKLDEGGTGR